MYLLDTDVVSELRKVRPGKADARFAAWAASAVPATLYLSAVTVHELEIGVLLAKRKDAARGAILRGWLDEHVLPAFAGRILAVDTSVARRSARLHIPDPRPVNDALIAGTALVHGLTVVTRNVADFRPTGVALLNPWEDTSDSAG
jgi:predicted nucleic acid-binding protein